MKAPALVAGAALVALVLTGCGGDNSSSTAASSPTTAASNANATTPSFTGSGSSDFCNFAKDLESSDIANSLTGDSTNVKDDLAKVRAALAQATAVLDDSKFAAASERVSAYAQQVCGIKDDTSTTS